MKIWKMNADVNHYAWVRTKEEWSLSKVQMFDGRSFKNTWIQDEIEVQDNKAALETGDMPLFYTHLPVISNRVKEKIEGLISEAVEFLPVTKEEEKFWVINILKVLDCVDMDNSLFKKLSTGKIIWFTKYEFIPEKIQSEHIFKISNLKLSLVFVSDVFKKVIEESGFKGFEFTLVWDSETGGVKSEMPLV